MQSTGHSSIQVLSLRSTQARPMTYGIDISPSAFRPSADHDFYSVLDSAPARRAGRMPVATGAAPGSLLDNCVLTLTESPRAYRAVAMASFPQQPCGH